MKEQKRAPLLLEWMFWHSWWNALTRKRRIIRKTQFSHTRQAAPTKIS
ncbi:hypothetical protein [Nitratidesulfovibrio liaohensis]|uniref:Uncharacterized protein n=1 Tax=Nitratidesulfovibrio liaohensis TaxID=2604158 RepID=A0ABY9R3W7_9BACT|nr:hypothetical protein [Nitratidesulfovibrio liaohensis]WMW66443.1 hypothetical protein KPS_001014 [Nitratidesulfovibrio liaohensis]